MLPLSPTDEWQTTIRTHHDVLGVLCAVPVESRFVVEPSAEGIAACIAEDNLIVVSSNEYWWSRLERTPRRIGESFGGASVVVSPPQCSLNQFTWERIPRSAYAWHLQRAQRHKPLLSPERRDRPSQILAPFM